MKKLAALIIGVVLMTSLLTLTGCGMEPYTNEEIGLLTDSDIMERYIDQKYGSEYNGELYDERCDDEHIVFYLYNDEGMMEALCVVDRDYFRYPTE